MTDPHSKLQGIVFFLVLTTGSAGILTSASAESSPSNLVDEIKALKHELDAQRTATHRLEKKLEALVSHSKSQSSASKTQSSNESSSGANESSGEAGAILTSAGQNALSAGYANGFFIKDGDGNNSLYINGLLQARFNHFATHQTWQFGAIDQTSNVFDVFLGRLYFSGNIIDPSVQYFYTLQGTTAGNGSGITLLDAKMSKTFDPFLTISAGRFWSSYTYEYYTDIGKYLFPDLSAAEWAFSLGRIVGAQASGQNGKFSYAVSVSNSVPGSDVSFTENTKSQLATIVHANYDILEPYGFQESDPNPAGVWNPQLSLWASGMYNVVSYASVFQNAYPDDKTYGATSSLNFRYGYLSFQGTGYFQGTEANTTGFAPHRAFNSYGWSEQVGFYIIPGTLELAERIDGVGWGRAQIPFTGGAEHQWWAGPGNFSYKNLTEYTGGLNYYLHGHNAKVQLAYSYIKGNENENAFFYPPFSWLKTVGKPFNAQRLILQSQLAF
ncbi:hypothetical protein [Methylocystis bryophila]|uniref:Porin n=1 Tax=Methylocystis bryophila TaxID=655015 RepID=A0A1W6MS75_9HYPH|nr:hypothetical protein [Methylocystis bryophila]ARN80444.1 hypothetical protein B1812_04440 [Methylocystis bryophila]BDV40460.1 hypothetical protein DSM21852_37130 [Methylocystis bryophila]